MTNAESPPAENTQERKNGDLPVVIISEPGSPEFVGKIVDQDAEDEGEERAFFEDDDCVSFDGSQMNQEIGFSSLTLNAAGGVDINGLPTPPDGGYGWVIVIAAFMSNLVVDGICTAFSEFKQSYSEHFQSSDATTALIGSLLIGSYLLVGPIVGGLVNKLGARKTVILGSIIGGLGMGLSVAAPNIVVFMLLYGVVGGIGFGMIYLPAIVVVGFYFESKRAVATGIAVAGSGVGTIIMPMMSEYCIKTIGWQYTIWVLALWVFSCVFWGLLYRPLEANVPSEPCKEHELQPLHAAPEDGYTSGEGDSPSKRTQSGASHIDLDLQSSDPVMARLRNALSECENDHDESPSIPSKPQLSPLMENATSKSRAGSTNQGPTVRPRKLTITSMASDMTSTQDLKASRGNLSSQANRMSARSFAQSLSKLNGRDSSLSIALSGVDPQEFARPMNRQDVFYGGSIRNLQEFKDEGENMQAYRGSVLSIPHSTIGAALSQSSQGLNGDLNDIGSRMGGSRMSRMTGGLAAEDVDDFYDDSKCKCIPLPVRNAFGEMIDFQLLKEPVMLLLCISNLLGMMGFYIPFVFLKDLATANEIDPELSKYLVPIIGVTNTVGRIFFGWISDRGYVTALAINNFALISCGFLTMICPFLTNFWGLVAYSAIFGFIISAYICLTSIVLADLLGLEKLTNSFGLLVVARGVASLSGSPFAGLVYDITKSYQACFYFAGAVIVIAGLISCVVPYFHKKQRSRGGNEGNYFKDDQDNMSGKLSVLTERSEENLTDYQRTIQSLRQQYQLLQEMEEEKKRMMDAEMQKNGTVEEVNEEEAPIDP